jgi:putative DNA primase/helicase
LHQPYTDTGNAERLVELHGSDIRFCSETKKWLVWDGHRWNAEDAREVKVLAKQTIRQMYVVAAAIGNAEIKEAAEKHARRSESASSIHAMLTCAEYEPGIRVRIRDLDQNKYLLNVLNGTLDLRTGELRKHRREDLITKLVHFDFDPTAKCPRFLQFLERIMGGPGPGESEQPCEEREARSQRVDRLISYSQKCFGYATTADVSEKAVFCFFGSGNNGKTTLLEATRFILREYSAQVLIDNLMAHHSRESNASLADLGDLQGARFVTTSEAEEGQRLAVGKLKYLTQGLGEIKTCRKYENPVTFLASHKLFLDANHKPIIRGAEKAVWNRLKLIPFSVIIPPDEIDKSLLDALKREGAGILRWMVDGARRWWKEGLGDPPDEITKASAAWEAESDRFATFLEDRCQLPSNANEDSKKMWVSVTNLWAAYVVVRSEQ